MEVATSREALRKKRRTLAIAHHDRHGKRPIIGLTPTMGALHAGHMALIERMAGQCDVSMVSIFVNPAQFEPGSDFERYPRALDADCALCEEAGVGLVYAPAVEDVYPEGQQTTVKVAELSKRWCGAGRPGHFDGVTTVVAKLLCICQPDRAYFGEKDYQQLKVVQRMVHDLGMEVEIVPCPTVREPDGLARSSRNAYLSETARLAAPGLYGALAKMNELFSAGERGVAALLHEGKGALAAANGQEFQVEYLAVVDAATLEPRERAQAGDRVLVAAKLAPARLIDNIALTTQEEG
ncbi:pantoate--beta-alanine ligase [bacterium]|nr:pantoate--beta-alanine ligase [bacterium]